MPHPGLERRLGPDRPAFTAGGVQLESALGGTVGAIAIEIGAGNLNISTLKAQHCSGLRGKAKAACNHAQIGVCHAAFNVPSSHNN